MLSTEPSSPAESSRASPDRSRRGTAVFVIGVCALGLGVDIAEMALGGVLSAVFSAGGHAATALQLSLLLASSYFGAVFGALVISIFADRFPRPAMLVGLCGAIAVATVVFVAGAPYAVILAANFCLMFCVYVLATLLNLFGAERFPLEVRTGMSALFWSINRVGSVIGLFVLVPVLRHYGPSYAAALIVACLVLAVLLVCLEAVKSRREASGR